MTKNKQNLRKLYRSNCTRPCRVWMWWCWHCFSISKWWSFWVSDSISLKKTRKDTFLKRSSLISLNLSGREHTWLCIWNCDLIKAKSDHSTLRLRAGGGRCWGRAVMAGILGAPSFTGNKSDEEKEQILYQIEKKPNLNMAWNWKKQIRKIQLGAIPQMSHIQKNENSFTHLL